MARRGGGRTGGADLTRLGSYEQVVRTFKNYDANGDNKFSQQELHALMMQLNNGRWNNRSTDVLLAQMDVNQDRTIDIDEFVNYIFPRQEGQNAMGSTVGASEYERVMNVFRSADNNRSGGLCQREFTQLMMQLQPGWTAAQTGQCFSGVDKDRSGEIDADELIAWIFGVPRERTQARRAVQRGRAAPQDEEVAYVIVDFTFGDRNSQVTIDRIAHKWNRHFQGKVQVNKINQGGRGITRVATRDGRIVLWDQPSMMAYRENPFRSLSSTEAFLNEMERVHLPRLIAGT